MESKYQEIIFIFIEDAAQKIIDTYSLLCRYLLSVIMKHYLYVIIKSLSNPYNNEGYI